MKFQQYLTDGFVKGVKKIYKYVEIFKNPSLKELLSMLEVKKNCKLRWIYDPDHKEFIFWDAYYILHKEGFRETIGIDKMSNPKYLYGHADNNRGKIENSKLSWSYIESNKIQTKEQAEQVLELSKKLIKWLPGLDTWVQKNIVNPWNKK